MPTDKEPACDLDLATAEHIDMASMEFTYERLRQLARNKNLSRDEKIGFPDSYRVGYTDAILSDIVSKFNGMERRNGTLVDIGCGCGSLVQGVVALLHECNLKGIMVDSEEMLAQVPDNENIKKVAGFFPKNIDSIRQAAPEGADYLLCYSVLHCSSPDLNLFSFIDNIIDVLKPGGLALIGDIPNVSKRKRFFSSAEGIAFHKSFMKTDQAPAVEWLKVEHDKIDDAVLCGLVRRAQAAGCDAYILPQPSTLPMANRRDDLLIRKY